MGPDGHKLSLRDHATFDLARVQLPLPHSARNMWPIFRPWSGEWTELQRAVPWADIVARAPQGGPQIHIYTDGSANDTTRQSGYSAVILMKLGAAVAIFGVLGGQILGNPDSPWPRDGPTALTAEQVAVAAALLGVVQAKSMLPFIDCNIHVDCLAAGRAATGQWAPVDDLSVQIHNLELAIPELPDKGHAGDGWNEFADGVAKRAAKGASSFAELP